MATNVVEVKDDNRSSPDVATKTGACGWQWARW